MVDVIAGGQAPLLRLIYRSCVRLLPDRRRDELDAIFEVAREKNAELGVTGALLIWEDAFVQVLEGEESAVRTLYGTIHADYRHDHVALLDTTTVAQRTFAAWSMARVGDDDGADIPVARDRDAAMAAPRPGSTEQNSVLDLMREYARADMGWC